MVEGRVDAVGRLRARVRAAEPDHMMTCVDEFRNEKRTDKASRTRNKSPQCPNLRPLPSIRLPSAVPSDSDACPPLPSDEGPR